MSPNRDYVTVSMSHATLIADVGAIGRVLSVKGEYSVDQSCFAIHYCGDVV